MKHRAAISDAESSKLFTLVSIDSLRHDPKTSLNWWREAPFPTMLIWASRIYEFQLYMERIMGFQPARGLSREVGYHSGVDGAAAIRGTGGDAAQRPGPVDLLLQGPAVLAGAGWGRAEVEYDDSTGVVVWTFPSGTAFGVAAKAQGPARKNPACTFMEGFISGWTNESLGAALEFAETTCVAKGDDHCSFLSAPLAKKRASPH